MPGIFVPYDTRALVKGAAQFWVAPVDAPLPHSSNNKWAIDTSEDGILTINEQTVEVKDADAGTFTLAFHGQETAALDHDVDAAALEAALEGLSTIGAGNVEVATANGVHTVTFLNHLRRMHIPHLQVTDNSLTITGDGTPRVEIDRDWQEVGNKEDGLNVNMTDEQEAHFVLEHFAPIDRSRTAEGVQVSCNVVHTILEKLALHNPSGAYSQTVAGATQTAYESFTFGDGTSDPFFQGLIYAVNGMGKPYVRHLFRVKPLVAGERAFQKNQMWYIPTQWTAFADQMAAPGQTLYKDYNVVGLPTG